MLIRTPAYRLPIFKILMPFAAGIILSDLYPTYWLPIILGLAAIALYSLITFLTHTPLQRIRVQSVLSVIVLFVPVSAGWFYATLTAPNQIDIMPMNGQIAVARVQKIDFSNYQNIKAQLEILHFINDSNNREYLKHPVMVDTRIRDYSQRLKPGDVIIFKSSISPLRSTYDSEDFDYAQYANRKGIFYRQTLSGHRFSIVGSQPTLRTRTNELKNRLIKYIYYHTSNSEIAELSMALIMGERTYLNNHITTNFRQAGISHILALSGLHISILSLVIWLILMPLDKFGGKRLRLAITMIMVALFAYFSGLSGSVLRASIMMSFVCISYIYSIRIIPVNSLMVSAFLILLYSPWDLFNPGFQLSFISVWTIIATSELTEPLRRYRNNYFLRKARLIAMSVIITLATTICTWGLTAYHFSNISFIGILANLIVIPIFPLFMLAIVAKYILMAFLPNSTLIDPVIEVMYKLLNEFVTLVNSIPYSSYNYLYVTAIDTLLFYFLILLLHSFLWYRKPILLVSVISIVMLLIGSLAWNNAPSNKRGVIIFNDNTCTPILCFNRGQAVLMVYDNQHFTANYFTYNHRRTLNYLGIKEPKVITQKPNNVQIELDRALVISRNMFQFGTHIHYIAGRGYWKQAQSQFQNRVDRLVVSRDFNSKYSYLYHSVKANIMIISGAKQQETNEKYQPWQSILAPKQVHNLATAGNWIEFQ